ncbi:hypothetical protein [Microbulbifer sp. TRSA005]|uniref:hypothetical protein n=1 Tax=Microbulbifer sp. TRSA005 TaxID=3243383 RepID=UPI0040393C0E
MSNKKQRQPLTPEVIRKKAKQIIRENPVYIENEPPVIGSPRMLTTAFYKVLQSDFEFMAPYFDPDEVEDKRRNDDFVIDTKPIKYAEDWVPLEIKFSIDDAVPVIPTLSKWQNCMNRLIRP